MRTYLLLTLTLVVVLGSALPVFAQSANSNDPLVQVLQAKGILTEAEARAITVNATPAEQRDRLALILRDKGVISSAEFAALHAAPAAPTSPPVTITKADYKPEPPPAASAEPQATPVPVVAAIAPVRLIGVDVPKREGLIPDIKLGTGARLKFYGLFKTSVVHDSSSPQGNDFPLPLLAQDTGPNNSPEFHLRARGLRLGANFEWLEIAPKTTLTGKIEFDFEGDFPRVNNRNITSIRSSQPSLRLAWVRIDRRFSDDNSAFVLFGQDWSPFVSSTLPNMIENTNFGGVGYGAAYTRIPQARFGWNHKFGGSRDFQFQPEFAIVLPAFGNLPGDVSNQLAFGERQGVDSEKPAIQGRAVFQWQLDKAPSVAPAQLIVSFEHMQRTAIVTAANVPLAFRPAFPNGVEVSSDSDGYSAEFQLPTRFLTAVGKYYGGSDLRFFLAGQLLSNFNDTAGLTNIATAPSIDASSTVAFGLDNGIPVVAPQRPVRAQGGFVQLGFPLSRLFDADPKGRNAGWTAFLYYGFDQAKARDARRFGLRGGRSDLFSGNIQYKWNQWVTFAYEEGYYRTRADARTGALPLFRGIPSYTTHNIRSEFAAIFTF
ncbi:MAG TPA: hypothetical protein VFR51_12260 [Pyrinomonadaceae bacterium]|nr:hypothetical protein [Pyrinomonadaceae bacterium]